MTEIELIQNCSKSSIEDEIAQSNRCLQRLRARGMDIANDTRRARNPS